jgi:arylsulfatase A-like enzyme
MQKLALLISLIFLATNGFYSKANDAPNLETASAMAGDMQAVEHFPAESSAVSSAEKPNIVFILVDDLGWSDIGAFGSSFYDTPNIDRLAAEGMKFTNAYAMPICSPTRASIMAGKNPARMNTTDWFGAPQPSPDFEFPGWMASRRQTPTPLMPAAYTDHLPLEEVTLAEAMKEGGYSTFFAGKWHLGNEEKYWPEHQGFDINKGGYLKGSPNTGGEAEGYFSPYGNPRLADGADGEYLPYRLAEETNTFMEDHRDGPFLAYLSFYSVHTPLMTTDELKKKYELKRDEEGLQAQFGTEGGSEVRVNQSNTTYAGMVNAMHRAVGRVLDKLEELNLSSNTVVMFMSDNGGLSTINNAPTSNEPLRAGKGWLYEGGIREPMIIKWPGVTKAGSVAKTPVISMDFYPTMLDIAGLPLKPNQHKDGMSLAPILRGEPMDRGPLYWHYPHYPPQGGFPGGVIREGDWKLIHNYDNDIMELYNLKDDISEENNLLQQYPQKAIELYQKLDEWRNEVGGRMPIPNPNYTESD